MFTTYSKGGCFCCHDWHVGHTVTTVPGGGGVGVKLWCNDCKVLADLQAVGHSISPEGSETAADCVICMADCPSKLNHHEAGAA